MSDPEQCRIFSKNLKHYIQVSGKKQNQIAKDLGISPQRINKWCVGEAIPDMGMIQRLADYFNIRKSHLVDERVDKIPILRSVSNGEPVMMDQEYYLPFTEGSGLPIDFGLEATGDSMIGAGINDGDMVFIHKQDTIENGEIAAVAIGNDALLKRYYSYPKKAEIVLRSENPDYKDKIYTYSELDEVRLLGKAIASLKIL